MHVVVYGNFSGYEDLLESVAIPIPAPSRPGAAAAGRSTAPLGSSLVGLDSELAIAARTWPALMGGS